MLTAELPTITGFPPQDLPLPVIQPGPQPPATLKQTALASFVAIEGHMYTLAERYRDVVFDVATPKGMKEAKAARLALREEGRFPVQRLVQRLKDEANDLKKALDDRGAEVIALTKPVEDAIHRQIEVEEQRVAAEKAEKVRIEAERVEALQAKLNGLSVWIERCREPGMTAERIGNGISMFAAVPMHPEEWQEFHARALARHGEVLDVMVELHRQAIEREAEAARLEAQRIENERIAAAQRAEAERLAAERAELERQQAQLHAKELQQKAVARFGAAMQGAVARVGIEAAYDALPDVSDRTAPFTTEELNAHAATLDALQPAPKLRLSVIDELAARAKFGMPIEMGKAENPAAVGVPPEAATIQRSEMAVLQSAGQHSQESACSTQAGRQDETALGGAEQARGIHAEDSEDLSGVAPGPLHHPTGPADEACRPATATETAQRGAAEGVELATHASGAGNDAKHAADLRGPEDSVGQNAQESGCSAGTPATCASSEAESATASPSGDEGPVAQADDSAADPDPEDHEGGIDLLRECLALCEHAAQPFAGRFPSHPKPDPAWWAALRDGIDKLQPRLLMALARWSQ